MISGKFIALMIMWPLQINDINIIWPVVSSPSCVLVKTWCRPEVKGRSHRGLTVHSMCFINFWKKSQHFHESIFSHLAQTFSLYNKTMSTCRIVANTHLFVFNPTRLRLEWTLRTVNVPSALYVGTLCTSVAVQLLFSRGTSIPWLWQPSSFCVCGWQNTLTC